jgi:hypothetical protein
MQVDFTQFLEIILVLLFTIAFFNLFLLVSKLWSKWNVTFLIMLRIKQKLTLLRVFKY